MEFLKKHYEKIVLCVVLLGLAGAVVWMRSALSQANQQSSAPRTGPMPMPMPRGPRMGARGPAGRMPTNAALAPLDLSSNERALSQITNPPTVVLSGDHNTFNPVTWKRDAKDNLFKVVKIGSDALIVTNIVPFYTVIAYDHPAGDGGIYVMNVQSNVDLRLSNAKKKVEYVKKDEKKSFYTVRAIKGPENNPSEIELEVPLTGQSNVWVSTNQPYKYVSSYYADLIYVPDSLLLPKQRVNDDFTLDKLPYKIVEITNDTVRVLSKRTTKVTDLKWSPTHNGN